ncbi:MAG: hypothetical protein PHY02_06325 [Phycisphaerae bacterium]|nr:hypothetical protein [Phycisphaerae bacterium]
MAGFLYAIPNDSGLINEQKIKEAGLMNIFGDIMPNFSQRDIEPGPGGMKGALICIGSDVSQLYYKPNEQTWQQSLNGKYWVGIINNSVPGEQFLRRYKQLNGHEVELKGEKWLIPLARMFPEGTMLPQTLLIGAGGKVIKETIPQYAEFSRKAETLWEDIQKILGWMEGERKLTEEEKMGLVVDAMAFNYHVAAEEINALKLITTANLFEIYGAIVDLPTIKLLGEEIAAQKKTGTEGTEPKVNDG